MNITIHTFQTKEVAELLLGDSDYFALMSKCSFKRVRDRYTWVKKIINSTKLLSIPDDNNVVYGFCNVMNDYKQLRSFSYYLPEICQYFGMRPSERLMLELSVPEECLVYTDSGREIYREDNFILSKDELDDCICQVMLPYIKAEWLVDVIDIEDDTVTCRHFKDLVEDFTKCSRGRDYIWSFKPRLHRGIMKDDIDLVYSNGFPDIWRDALNLSWYSN